MKTILIIDDQRDNLISIGAVIKTNLPEHRVLTAQSGQEGIEKAIQHHPDCILLDIIMPHMDGYETCSRLKIHPDTSHIPVIMITAIRTDTKSRVKGLETGADAFLSKPVDYIELSTQLKVMLRIKEAEDKLRDENKNLEGLVAQRTAEILEQNKTLTLEIKKRVEAEEVLRESEEKFRDLSNLLPQIVYEIDIDGMLTYVNRQALKTFGYTQKEFNKGINVSQVLAPEDREKGQRNIQNVLHRREVRSTEYIAQKKDGTKFPITIYSNAIFKAGKAVGTRGVIVDITEQKQSEVALRDSELKYRLLATNTLDTIWTADKEFNLNFINDAVFQFLGYTPDEIIGMSPKVFTPPEGSAILKSAAEYLIRRYQEGEISQKTIELQQIKKDGTTIDVKVVSNVLLNSKGQFVGFQGRSLDITKRKRAEKLKQVMYNISNAVLHTDNLTKLIGFIQRELGTIIDTTNFYVAFYDENTDSLTFPYCADEKDAVDPNPIPAGKTLTKYVIETNKSLLADIALKNRFIEEGKLELVGTLSKKWLGVPLKIEGKVNGVFAVQSYTDKNAYDEQDVNMLEFVSDQISLSIHRKKTEEDLLAALLKAKESDRLKSAFLANMSHEIRTPMNGILGFADLLKEPDLTGEEQKHYVEIIENSGERMLNIINDLIDISKIEAGQMDISLSETNINEQIEYLYTFFKPEAKSKGLNLTFKSPLINAEATVKTDKEKVYAILTNLVKNAIKYTQKGNIEFGYVLTNNSKSANAKQAFVQFYVKDTGIGIPEERQAAIFDRFVQADIEDIQVFEGAGLGLAITKAYVEMLGGELWVTSQVGLGSEFNFTIPIDSKVKIEEQFNLSKHANLEIPEHKKIKVLIAEDDPTSNLHLTIAMKNIARQIIHVSTGIDAIESCRENPDLDLILMDIKMPLMDGHTATRKIREFNKNIVIIAQTAYAISGDREKALESGCDDYISKPVQKKLLFEKIQKLIM